MSIKPGDAIPKATFAVMSSEGPKLRTTEDIFKGRRIVLFGVPGAFTPTCSAEHLPGFRDIAEEFKGKGVDEIAVTSVNDAFVMDAWAKSAGAADKISFLADGNGDFAKAIGLSLDLTERGLGTRSKRYSMLVDDGVVRKLNVEAEAGKATTSSAAALLAQI
jgi:peroxiredoxin